MWANGSDRRSAALAAGLLLRIGPIALVTARALLASSLARRLAGQAGELMS